MRTVALLCALCTLGRLVASQNDGWNFGALAGATDKTTASLLALSASFENGTDPRLPGWWSTFKATFYKTYASKAAEDAAYQNFLKNLDLIYATNSNIDIPFWLSGNFYADYDYESFRRKFLMTNLNITQLFGRRLREDEPVPAHELAARRRLQGSSVDWRTTGKLSPVEDQGGCGSCWAYAATTTIEAAYNIFMNMPQTTTKINLAEQQMIDCSGAGSCGGGGSDGAISYVASKFQVTSDLYPSTYKDGSCKYRGSPPSGSAVRLGAAVQYPGTGSESGLMRAVAKQPTVIYFHVVNDFFPYSGGIYQPNSCGNSLNHAMVAVGYVYTGNPRTSYWIIRNSWGGGWGQNGYAYVQMTGTSSGPCGMYLVAFQPPLDFSLTLTNKNPGGTPASPRAPGNPSAPSSPDYNYDSPPPPDYPWAPDSPAAPRPPRRRRPPPRRRSPPPSPPPPRRYRHRPPRPSPRQWRGQ